MNQDAGRGNWLFVTLRLESGAELPFFVDTGTAVTLFDKSLEPELGKRLGTTTFTNFGNKSRIGTYAAPPLYLGSVRLRTGRHVYSGDFQQLSRKASRPVMGILGMDCLRHYCIQLDFQTGKIRFLDPQYLNATELGTLFPLTFSFPVRLPFLRHRGLAGGKKTDLLIDTGYEVDGAWVSEPVQKETSGHRSRGERSAVRPDPEFTALPTCVWNGETYTDLLLGKEKSLLGLRFLARHLVTLDFPNRRMYLQQTSSSPLEGDRFVRVRAAVESAAESVTEFMRSLKEKGQLPGWSRQEEGTIRGTVRFNYYELYDEQYPRSATFDVRKNGDSSTYHYTVCRASSDSSWKLEEAWRTDQTDHTVEEYPVP